MSEWEALVTDVEQDPDAELLVEMHGWIVVRFPDDPNKLMFVHRSEPTRPVVWSPAQVIGQHRALSALGMDGDADMVTITWEARDGQEAHSARFNALEMLDALNASLRGWIRGMDPATASDGLSMTDRVQLALWWDLVSDSDAVH